MDTSTVYWLLWPVRHLRQRQKKTSTPTYDVEMSAPQKNPERSKKFSLCDIWGYFQTNDNASCFDDAKAVSYLKFCYGSWCSFGRQEFIPTRDMKTLNLIIRLLVENRTLGDIKTQLTKGRQKSLLAWAKPDIPVYLCASLLSMTEFEFATNRFGGSMLQWTDESKTFRDAIKKHFTHQVDLDPAGIKSEKGFTARNLGWIAGFRIEWTTNLAQHLLFSDDEKTVRIFPHVRFLKLHEE